MTPAMMTDPSCIPHYKKFAARFRPPPKGAGTMMMCGRGALRRPCVNHLRNGERYAVFRWLTICFAIGKGDSLYGTNTLRKSSDKRAYMQLEVKRARLFGFRGEMQSFFDRILRDDIVFIEIKQSAALQCQTCILIVAFLVFASYAYRYIYTLDYRLQFFFYSKPFFCKAHSHS